MKKSIINIIKEVIKAIKNHNRLYTVLAFWAFWLFVIVGYFAGTYMALFLFFFGFMLTICFAAYVMDKPNEKEQKFMNKMAELISD